MSWIKLEAHTADKLEIFAMAQELGIDPDAVLGKCFRVWSWFDANTVDGVTKSVTKVMLDRQCGVTGFCQAMINAGWMHDDGVLLQLPYYDRHNSQSAKSRALGAKRQARFKSNAPGNADGNASGNDGALPGTLHREEKRREEEPTGAFALDGADPIQIERRQKRRGTEEDYKVARWLFGVLLTANPTAKPPNWDTWANEVRLMREVDGRTHHEIGVLFKWAKNDSFWSPNIQSPGKLREKWDTLTERRAKAEPEPAPPPKKDWI